MTNKKICGELEIDENRGVLYFHNYRNGFSTLRICGLGDSLKGFSETSQLDISIQNSVVMRSETGLRGPPSTITGPTPRTFFLNEQHTTHISKAQARRERAQAREKNKKKLCPSCKHLAHGVYCMDTHAGIHCRCKAGMPTKKKKEKTK